MRRARAAGVVLMLALVAWPSAARASEVTASELQTLAQEAADSRSALAELREVDLVDGRGQAVARGLVNYDSDELPPLLGRTTHALKAELGAGYEREVVHRDDLVLLRR